MNEIILIVEDMPAEQNEAKEVPRKYGFRVAIAATLSDALRIWNQLGIQGTMSLRSCEKAHQNTGSFFEALRCK
jgi:CheY-like chemotaxis protein